MPDRRANVRAVVRLEVESLDLQRVPLYVTANLSRGGMFLITRNPLPERTEMRLRFTLPGDPDPIQALARVMWVREESAAGGPPPGMGVRFLKCPAGDQERIIALVEEWDRIQAEGGPPGENGDGE